MLNNNIIANLLNLGNLKTKINFENEKIIQLLGETTRSKQICPCCGNPTSKIHDYRMQTVNARIRNIRNGANVCKRCESNTELRDFESRHRRVLF